jgi:Mrp family chromosome partitioning ATPase
MLNIDVGNLTLLPAGRKVGNPAELLSSRRMQDFLDDMKHRYSDRYIIIDTPPVLPFAETFSLSTMVDSVLFVVREGTSSLKNIGDALEVLGKESLLGIVYNDASDEGSFGHYQYYYSYRKYVTAREK